MIAIGSLFAGLGLIELGLERAMHARGVTTLWQVEQNEFCRSVLAQHWLSADRSISDVTFAGRHNLARVDVICGGFPCTDLSVAGRKAGIERGHKSGLWREYRRIVKELAPTVVVVENVAHTWRRWAPRVRSDLERIGYRSLLLQLSAAEVGAPHERKRCFVVAHTDSRKLRRLARWWTGKDSDGLAVAADDGEQGLAADADDESCDVRAPSWCGDAYARGLGVSRGWAPASAIRRMDDGRAQGLDGPSARRLRREMNARDRARLTALGNAVVPQVAFEIGRLVDCLL